ncbi:hypothetical protein D1872_256660 [compost metagenome]
MGDSRRAGGYRDHKRFLVRWRVSGGILRRLGCCLRLRRLLRFLLVRLLGIEQSRDFFRRFCFFQLIDKITVDQQPRERRQRTQMGASGSFRSGDHEEQVCRLAVQGFEIHTFSAFRKHDGRLVDRFRLGMGHGDAAADPCAGLAFTLQDRLFEFHRIVDPSVLGQAGDQLIDGRFLRGRRQVHDHRFFDHQVRNSHFAHSPV